ncbi:hypothetical protein Hanom_Chr07g00622151 [Helianthus anomalus]
MSYRNFLSSATSQKITPEEDELLKQSTGCIYFLSFPLTCKAMCSSNRRTIMTDFRRYSINRRWGRSNTIELRVIRKRVPK